MPGSNPGPLLAKIYLEVIDMTELEAVNSMLLLIKEHPVASIDTTTFSEALVAKEILERVKKEILLERWQFNTFTKVLPVDSFGRIPLPAFTIFAESAGQSKILVAHGDYLYDAENSTDIFTSAEEVTYVTDIAWGLIPLYLQQLIHYTASKQFEKRVRNSEKSSSWLDEEIARARARCNSMAIRQAMPTMTDNYRHSLLLNNRARPVNAPFRR